MKHESVTLPRMHFVFIEKVGPFQDTAMKAWQELHAKPIEGKAGAAAFYKFKPEMTYRAGWIVSQRPTDVPAGLKYGELDGGTYEKFTHYGSYTHLPRVSGDVWETVEKEKLPVRQDWAIERYLNDPATTPEEKLITEILVPVTE